jgi:hypothetical protein
MSTDAASISLGEVSSKHSHKQAAAGQSRSALSNDDFRVESCAVAQGCLNRIAFSKGVFGVPITE